MQNADPGYVIDFIDGLFGIVEVLLPIAVTLALIIFFLGIIKFLSAGGDPKARSQGKGLLIGGVVVLFVMVSVWGIVAVLNSIFGIDQEAEIEVPMVGGIDPF